MANLIIDWTSARSRPVNWVNQCDAVADSYPRGTPHGVQKDAVQNGVGAVSGSRPLEFEFELVTNSKGRFLTMTDRNTVGLTGRVLSRQEYTDDLAGDERWARFESMGFTRPDPDSIGARGQGKFVFMAASRQKLIVYDSLRSDGTYRFGYTQAQLNDCPMVHFDGDLGVQRLREMTGLPPLPQVGTRVIIWEPVDELIAAIRDGEFLGSIQETWFRLIEKGKAIIRVIADGRTDVAQSPPPYPMPSEDTEHFKVWKAENASISAGGEKYRVKRLHLACQLEGPVPEELRGVAIIHFGMKICSIPMDAPTQIRDSVFGFIEFDTNLDRQLRKTENQSPNHYDLHWRRRIPYAVKEYVNAQLLAFGRNRLGLGADPREARHRRRQAAEDWAMQQLQKFAKDLDLFGSRRGFVNPPAPPPPPPRELGVSINNFAFPDPAIAPRVNYGHTFADLTATVFNRTPSARQVLLSVRVLQGDSLVLELSSRDSLHLTPRANIRRGPWDIQIEEGKFPERGQYRLKAAIIDALTGDEIDSVARRFWVETDPPMTSPFDPRPVPSFPEPHEHRQWMISGAINHAPTVYYNTAHPAYRGVEDNEDLQRDYLLQVFLEAAIAFVLQRPFDDNGNPDLHPLNAEAILSGVPNPTDGADLPRKTFDEVARYLSEVRWRLGGAG